MNMIFKSENLTHDSLLCVLPFGSAYTCRENGEPLPESVMVAVALQSLQYVLRPSAWDPYKVEPKN
jgi:hypothetical protein